MVGLPLREYNLFIDCYLTRQPIHVESYEKMNDDQKRTVQIIKRALARLKARNKQITL